MRGLPAAPAGLPNGAYDPYNNNFPALNYRYACFCLQPPSPPPKPPPPAPPQPSPPPPLPPCNWDCGTPFGTEAEAIAACAAVSEPCEATQQPWLAEPYTCENDLSSYTVSASWDGTSIAFDDARSYWEIRNHDTFCASLQTQEACEQPQCEGGTHVSGATSALNVLLEPRRRRMRL